jgi:ferrous iron transport protein A
MATTIQPGGDQAGSPSGRPLGRAPRGFRGRVHAIAASDGSSDLPAIELESRLIELGFVEGAHVEILHEGAFARDPIAVRVNHATIALRRREAMSILATADQPA